MPGRGVATWMDRVLGQIVSRLAQRTGLPHELVFDTLAPQEVHLMFPPADQFVTVTPTQLPADQGTFAGSGRYAMGLDAVIQVNAFVRIGDDQEFQARRLLRGSTSSALALYLKIIDALAGYEIPSDEPNTFAVREPMRLNTLAIDAQRLKSGQIWSVASSHWQCRFTVNITP